MFVTRHSSSVYLVYLVYLVCLVHRMSQNSALRSQPSILSPQSSALDRVSASPLTFYLSPFTP